MTSSISNYTRPTPIASSSSQQRHPTSSSLSLTTSTPDKKLQTLIETSIPSTSASLAILDNSSLLFPYQHIRKRDTIRKMRTLSHNNSYNKQSTRISQTLEHSGTISKNSNSDDNSLAACSCQGCILGVLKKRVMSGNGKVKKVMKTVHKRSKGKFSKVQKSVINNKDVTV
ncbi:hypothetical protein C1645_274832 [Glomus cerebriforme]|uniref:Uncharacterized protein n=1 Tax=Glomus cerebriforme TaxID=658196 RepID=A0A397SY25_9GLOM|nr:hypothetical protein C1645_274832 [Glomus cerebriforme]